MWFHCPTCNVAYFVLAQEPNEIRQLLQGKTNFPCITPLCRGVMYTITSGLDVAWRKEEIPLRQFFRAIHGFGAGPGAPAAKEHVTSLLLQKRIMGVKAESIGQPERVLIHELMLEDGTRLHFASSTKGACIYYVEEPGKTCLEVVDNESRTGSDDREPGADGEEDRRGDEDGGCADEAAAPSGCSAAEAGAHEFQTADMPSVSESCSVQVHQAAKR